MALSLCLVSQRGNLEGVLGEEKQPATPFKSGFMMQSIPALGSAQKCYFQDTTKMAV